MKKFSKVMGCRGTQKKVMPSVADNQAKIKRTAIRKSKILNNLQRIVVVQKESQEIEVIIVSINKCKEMIEKEMIVLDQTKHVEAIV